MNCQNLEHEDAAPSTAVALVTVPGLYDVDGPRGYAVCENHLVRYVDGFFLGQAPHQRVPFTVEPVR